MNKQNSNQIFGNVGLFYVCYHLSRLGWNVMATARNAGGIEVLIYSQDAKCAKAIQIKTLSERSPVPLGRKLNNLLGDFLIVCRNVAVENENPECFVLTPKEVSDLAQQGEKDSRTSFWLPPKHYEKAKFRENWERIGFGAAKVLVKEFV